MTKKLFFEAIIKYLLGVFIVGCLLFFSAGTFEYWNAWLFMGLLFIPMFLGGIVLMIKNPNLLKRRLEAREKEKEQKEVVSESALMFLIGFLLAGFNYRYQWIAIPNSVVYIAAILFLLAYLLYAEVLRENTYLSRTIGVEKNQKVIDTGLYGVIRHPMYAVTILLFLMMPLVLGSIFSFLIFLVYPVLIMKRIRNEEEVLEQELKGYKDYQKKVKYRILPFIW